MPPSSEPRRSDCPISFALEIFGDRWTLIVLRDLMLKSRQRYRELLEGDEGIATNVLAERLKRLEHRKLVTKKRDPTDARQFIYLPTELAVSLVPMLVEMTVWGLRTSDNGIGAEYLEKFETDRDRLITELQAKIRKDAGLQ
ncbi:winged helix-turn-helix transcriptional regulator [Anderseniella sp. Alg231-50]|uniref:winged helix-turn-helix transcriptional regulator n=1 Tax=Anderseniella sp. Alg231-50 TaxID=1922226 RepID=UPI00307B5394